jgi:hypothetical protein
MRAPLNNLTLVKVAVPTESYVTSNETERIRLERMTKVTEK